MNREVSSMKPRVVVILGMHRSGTSVLPPDSRRSGSSLARI